MGSLRPDDSVLSCLSTDLEAYIFEIISEQSLTI